MDRNGRAELRVTRKYLSVHDRDTGDFRGVVDSSPPVGARWHDGLRRVFAIRATRNATLAAVLGFLALEPRAPACQSHLGTLRR
jgi:hypothetical protein